jgi:hypothetical protein
MSNLSHSLPQPELPHGFCCSQTLTLSAIRHRLNLVRDRMKNALDALEQALIS